jgi:hypothetical protein
MSTMMIPASSSDSDERNNSVASQSDFEIDPSSISDDENEPPSTQSEPREEINSSSFVINATRDETNALLGLEDSSSLIVEENEESSEEFKSAHDVLKERQPTKQRVRRFDTTVNHPKTKKRMMQPGKLVNPVDMQTQTIRRTGAIKSWLFENPEKREKLRRYLRGESDMYR